MLEKNDVTSKKLTEALPLSFPRDNENKKLWLES